MSNVEDTMSNVECEIDDTFDHFCLITFRTIFSTFFAFFYASERESAPGSFIEITPVSWQLLRLEALNTRTQHISNLYRNVFSPHVLASLFLQHGDLAKTFMPGRYYSFFVFPVFHLLPEHWLHRYVLWKSWKLQAINQGLASCCFLMSLVSWLCCVQMSFA